MSFVDDLPEPPVPARFSRQLVLEGDVGTASTGPVDELITSHGQLLEAAGLDPAVWEIVGKVSRWSKERSNGRTLHSTFFGFRKKHGADTTATDLSALIRPVKPGKSNAFTGVPFVVCIADAQVGKVDRLGGTAELLERWERVLARAVTVAKVLKPSEIILLDVGDCVENYMSTAPNQIASNDLTLDEQLRVWSRMVLQAIISFAPLTSKVRVAGVPSNHAEVRNSQGKVGNGDFGLAVLRTVQDSLELLNTGLNVEFIFPASEWDVVTFVPVGDKGIACFHGHHAKRLDNVPNWVALQAAAPDSVFGKASIVVSGHFHTRRYLESRGRDFVACPTLDNGSSWFRNLTGEFSNPGMAVFSVVDGRVTDLRWLD